MAVSDMVNVSGLLARISHTHHDSYDVASTSIPIPN